MVKKIIFSCLAFFAFTATAAYSEPFSPKVQKDLDSLDKFQEFLPLPMVIYIYNSEEKKMLGDGTISSICKIGAELNKKGIPAFNIMSLNNIFAVYEKEDYSSYGAYAKSMKTLVANIKLSAFIKTTTSTCKNVF